MAELLELSPADLAGDLLLRTHTLLSNAFPEDAPNEGDYYRTHGEPTAVLVLCEAPHVLGHLAPYLRQVRIGDEALEIGMLGGIVVAPEHRGRGCSRALVRHAHNRLRLGGTQFSILFAYEPRVYASCGYKLMQNETRFIDIDGRSKTLVYRGSMYAELAQSWWPNLLLDLQGRVV